MITKYLLVALCLMTFVTLTSPCGPPPTLLPPLPEIPPIDISGLNIHNDIVQSAVDDTNKAIAEINKVSQKVYNVFNELGGSLAEEFLKNINNIGAVISTGDFTSLKTLSYVIDSLKNSLQAIQDLFTAADKLGIPSDVVPFIGPLRITIGLAIPALGFAAGVTGLFG